MAFSTSVQTRSGLASSRVSSQVARPARATSVVRCSAEGIVKKAQDAAKVLVAVAASAALAAPVGAVTFDELQGLTYLQVKGSGIANTCPVIETGSSDLKSLKAGSYKFQKFCLEPTTFTVKEDSQFKGGESDFQKTKLMTRLTYTLDEIEGQLTVGSDGSVELKEDSGIDYAPVTVQLPGGERVPFLFTIKDLVAKGPASNFEGEFTVPSYRGSSFLDPKGRGGSTGYDTAVALPAAGDSEELAKENNKSVAALKGRAAFSLAKYDSETGEIAGVFESIQPSDTDLGAKAPKDVKITGIWYAQLQ